MATDGHGIHKHTHAQAFEQTSLDALGSAVFVYDPLSNAILAVAGLTAVTQTLIALSPPLSGSVLAFLVAFAEGGMLATTFVHMLPELEFTRTSGLVLIGGFLTFVIIDKAFKIIAGAESETTHSHAHSHAHIHSQHAAAPSDHASRSTAVEQPFQESSGLRQRKVPAETVKKPADRITEAEPINISPWLNVVADSLHNVTDGLSLAIAFRNGASTGFAAFLVMCCHEIPHQFGDFALLINTGTPHSTARRAQLVTALGTLVGCVFGSWFGAMSPVFEELVTPLTAGVFLYVSMVGVLPEILETDASLSRVSNAGLGAVQLLGIISGVGLLLLLD